MTSDVTYYLFVGSIPNSFCITNERCLWFIYDWRCHDSNKDVITYLLLIFFVTYLVLILQKNIVRLCQKYIGLIHRSEMNGYEIRKNIECKVQ